MLITTGDMNVKVGNGLESLERVMGRHGMATVNHNGKRLKEFCDFNEMVITGTIFPHNWKFASKLRRRLMEKPKIR